MTTLIHEPHVCPLPPGTGKFVIFTNSPCVGQIRRCDECGRYWRREATSWRLMGRWDRWRHRKKLRRSDIAPLTLVDGESMLVNWRAVRTVIVSDPWPAR